MIMTLIDSGSIGTRKYLLYRTPLGWHRAETEDRQLFAEAQFPDDAVARLRRKMTLKRPWLGDVIDALIADVPPEEWDKMPKDFASSVERARPA
jgi:hypothetical protein